MVTHHKALKKATQGEDWTKRGRGKGAKKERNSQSRKITVDIAFELGQIIGRIQQDTCKKFQSEAVRGKKLDEYLIQARRKVLTRWGGGGAQTWLCTTISICFGDSYCIWMWTIQNKHNYMCSAAKSTVMWHNQQKTIGAHSMAVSAEKARWSYRVTEW